MKQSVRAITITPEFWEHGQEQAIALLNKRMAEYSADLWIVCIGPADSAMRIMENLWMYGPAEEPLEQPV